VPPPTVNWCSNFRLGEGRKECGVKKDLMVRQQITDVLSIFVWHSMMWIIEKWL